MDTEQKPPSAAEIFAKAIINFPKHVGNNVLGILHALLTDWETTSLFTGAALIAYATGAYALVGGVLLVLYSLLRVVGHIAHEQALATGLLGRIIRDDPTALAKAEYRVALTQLPLVLTHQQNAGLDAQGFPPETSKDTAEDGS